MTNEARLDQLCSQLDQFADCWRVTLKRQPDLRPKVERMMLPVAVEAVSLVMSDARHRLEAELSKRGL